MNVGRFTLLVAFGGLAFVGFASACLSDLDALAAGDAGPDATTANPCGDDIVATLDDGGDAGEQCDPGPNPVLGCTPQCTISCGGVIGPSGHCYFLADPSDYNRALDICGAAGAHVVTIGSDDERAHVRALVGAGSYRVGLRVTNDDAYQTPPRVEEPGWPIGGSTCAGCFALGQGDAGLFESRGDAGGPQSCLVATPDDRWLRVPCSETDGGYLTVCEREPAGQRAQYCGGPYCTTLPATAGRKRYVISLAKATAAEADAFCRGFDGGSLVVFDSREEREQLAREVRTLTTPEPSTDVWIGLAKVDGAWRWDDATALDAGRPLPWADGEPRAEGEGHAFMQLNPNQFDTQLAVTEPEPTGTTQLRFVCQRR